MTAPWADDDGWDEYDSDLEIVPDDIPVMDDAPDPWAETQGEISW